MALHTFRQQENLPRLPVPTLEETAKTYLKSLEPLLTAAEWRDTKANVSAFIAPGGVGEQLQRALVAYDRREPMSWLERLWLEKAYHAYRDTVMINVNWWSVFQDYARPTSPIAMRALQAPVCPGGPFTRLQVHRAAILTHYVLDYMHQIYTEAMPVDTVRGAPLCMNQYRCMFGVTRVPCSRCDSLHYAPVAVPCQADGANAGTGAGTRQHHALVAPSRHILLMIDDQCFSVDVLEADGRRCSISTIERRLLYFVRKVVQMGPRNRQPPIAILTSEHRDRWAKAHQTLQAYALVNQQSFDHIKNALFSVNLDATTPVTTTASDASAPGSPTMYEQCAAQTFHGAGGRNRWFDKSLSYIVFPDGHGGMNGEHSPCDAVMPELTGEYALLKEEECSMLERVEELPLSDAEADAIGTMLEWQVPPTFHEEFLEPAMRHAEKEIENNETLIFKHTSMGAKDLKKLGVSPDAFMQMALQLAYFRLHKKPTPTYETASTRSFLHGRTETVRVLSSEAVAFCRSMANPLPTAGTITAKHQHAYDALQKAIAAHRGYMAMASKGHGVDRHLLGLRCMLPADAAVPSIFTDPAFAKSCSFNLSTSNVSPALRMAGLGFGPVMPTGYGINYSISDAIIKASISTKRANPESDGHAMRKSMRAAMDDIAKLLAMFPSTRKRAKL